MAKHKLCVCRQCFVRTNDPSEDRAALLGQQHRRPLLEPLGLRVRFDHDVVRVAVLVGEFGFSWRADTRNSQRDDSDPTDERCFGDGPLAKSV